MTISLKRIVPSDNQHVSFLYELLLERPAYVSISHQLVPTFEDHRKFVEDNPYEAWYLIHDAGDLLGSIYITKPAKPSVAGDEIGIQISAKNQGNGYAKQAIKMLMMLHPRKRYLANIAPNNVRSSNMFSELGFTVSGHTFELRTKC